MESDTIESSSESKLPLFAGIGGLLLGVIALVLSVKAKNAADAATAAAQLADQKASETQAKVESKVDSATFQNFSADYTDFKGKSEKAFQDMAVAFNNLSKAVESRGSRSSGGNGGNVTAGPGEYIVAKGDTLSGIARKAGISLKALRDLNPGVGDALKIGQKLKVK